MRIQVLIPSIIALALAACSPSGEPNSPPKDAALPDKEDARLISWLNEEFLDIAPVQFRAGRVDLDGDGTDEVLAYVSGELACERRGCPLVVLKDDGKKFTKVSETDDTMLPVGALDTKTDGWSDLWVTTAGEGGKTQVKKLAFDGKAYPAKTADAPVETSEKPLTETISQGDLAAVD